jgi:hypothetical protein
VKKEGPHWQKKFEALLDHWKGEIDAWVEKVERVSLADTKFQNLMLWIMAMVTMVSSGRLVAQVMMFKR